MAPGGQKRRQYSTLGPLGTKNVDSTTLWGPRAPKAPTAQHFGAPGAQKRRQYSTLGPLGPKGDDSTTLWGSGGGKCNFQLLPKSSAAPPPLVLQLLQLLQLLALGAKSADSTALWAPGAQKRRQYNTLGPQGPRSDDSAALWGPGGKLQISVAPESSAAPLPPPWCCRCCSFVAVLGPWGPKAPTVLHFGAPGPGKRRQRCIAGTRRG